MARPSSIPLPPPGVQVLASDGPCFSYSPTSSPQLTPTLETVSSFVGASFLPSLCKSGSSSSLDSQTSFAFSELSRRSSASSLESSFDDDEPPSKLLCHNSCRYAGLESAPASLRGKASLGGVGMFRSYSNPVATLETTKAREMMYAEELRRQEHLHDQDTSLASSDPFTTEYLTMNTPYCDTPTLKNRPQDPIEARPLFGRRWHSFEPNSPERDQW